MAPFMSDPTPQEVRRYIADGLACEHLEVEGDGRHFFATIVSAEFEGLLRVRRHQRVYAALGDRMKAQIHALSMKTLTPAEWAGQRTTGDAGSHASHGISAAPPRGRVVPPAARRPGSRDAHRGHRPDARR